MSSKSKDSNEFAAFCDNYFTMGDKLKNFLAENEELKRHKESSAKEKKEFEDQLLAARQKNDQLGDLIKKKDQEILQLQRSTTQEFNDQKVMIESLNKELADTQKDNDLWYTDMSKLQDKLRDARKEIEKLTDAVIHDDLHKEGISWRLLKDGLSDTLLLSNKQVNMAEFSSNLQIDVRRAIFPILGKKLFLRSHQDRDTIQSNVELMRWLDQILCGNSYFEYKDNDQVKKNVLIGCATCFILDVAFFCQSPKEGEYRSLISEDEAFLKRKGASDDQIELITILGHIKRGRLQSDPKFEEDFPEIAKNKVLNFFKTISPIATARNSAGEEEEIISEGVVHPDFMELAATFEKHTLSRMKICYKMRQRQQWTKIVWPDQATHWETYVKFPRRKSIQGRKLITTLPAFEYGGIVSAQANTKAAPPPTTHVHTEENEPQPLNRRTELEINASTASAQPLASHQSPFTTEDPTAPINTAESSQKAAEASPAAPELFSKNSEPTSLTDMGNPAEGPAGSTNAEITKLSTSDESVAHPAPTVTASTTEASSPIPNIIADGSTALQTTTAAKSSAEYFSSIVDVPHVASASVELPSNDQQTRNDITPSSPAKSQGHLEQAVAMNTTLLPLPTDRVATSSSSPSSSKRSAEDEPEDQPPTKKTNFSDGSPFSPEHLDTSNQQDATLGSVQDEEDQLPIPMQSIAEEAFEDQPETPFSRKRKHSEDDTEVVETETASKKSKSHNAQEEQALFLQSHIPSEHPSVSTNGPGDTAEPPTINLHTHSLGASSKKSKSSEEAPSQSYPQASASKSGRKSNGGKKRATTATGTHHPTSSSYSRPSADSAPADNDKNDPGNPSNGVSSSSAEADSKGSSLRKPKRGRPKKGPVASKGKKSKPNSNSNSKLKPTAKAEAKAKAEPKPKVEVEANPQIPDDDSTQKLGRTRLQTEELRKGGESKKEIGLSKPALESNDEPSVPAPVQSENDEHSVQPSVPHDNN